ncbi:MAG TPA: tRNA-dihydrouridine synthase, partial [Actinomycetes bacterium]|nr:tRNA-dihydrouridine synthase [Actinomycetes bacterium]
DAVRMMAETGCDGVVIGRGCLGRPWLFADLAAAFTGEPPPPRPTLGDVAHAIRRHAELLGEFMGEERGLTDLRKHMAWYLKGFVVGSDIRSALGRVSSLAELDVLLAQVDAAQPFPESEIGLPRGRQGSPRRVSLPDGWLDDQLTCTLGADAESDIGGG